MADKEFREQLPALERFAGGAANQLRMIVVLADMTEHQCRDSGIEIVFNELGGDFVRQMAAAAHDALFNAPGVRPDAQHFQIVIRFEHQQIGAAQMHTQRICDVAQVGGDGNFDSLRSKREAHRIDGIVRDGETRNIEIADSKRAAGLKLFEHGSGLPPINETCRAVGEIDRKARFRTVDQNGQPVGVVRMLMRNQDGAQSVNVFSNGGQALRDFAAA